MVDIPLSSDALDIAFHPDSSTNIIAAGLLSGKVQLIDYSAAPSFKKTLTLRPSIKSTRALAFSLTDSNKLWSASKDRSIFGIDTSSGQVVSHWSDTHDAPPSRIITLPSGMIVTGDDDGAIKLWDPRTPTSSASEPAAKKLKLSSSTSPTNPPAATTPTPVRSYEHHFDWISELLWCDHLAPPKQNPKDAKGKQPQKQQQQQQQQQSDEGTVPLRSRLVATSGDGTLSVIDFRQGGSSKKDASKNQTTSNKRTGVEVSEDQEDELLAVAPVKAGSKFVVGTQLGVLSVWAPTRAMLDHVDRIPGHPASVDTLCTLHDPNASTDPDHDIVAQFAQDDDVLLTGSSDGLIRILQIGPPHKLLGVLADHGGGGMPVERIRRKGRWVASIGHESAIKWSDLAELLDGDSDDEDENADKPETAKKAKLKGKSAVEDEDDEDDDESLDDDDEEDEDEDLVPRPDGENDDDEDEDDEDSDSDEPSKPSTSSSRAPQSKAARLSKALAAGTLLSSTSASIWNNDGDDDSDDEGRRKKSRKGGMKKSMKGHDQANARRAERAAFFSDM